MKTRSLLIGTILVGSWFWSALTDASEKVVQDQAKVQLSDKTVRETPEQLPTPGSLNLNDWVDVAGPANAKVDDRTEQKAVTEEPPQRANPPKEAPRQTLELPQRNSIASNNDTTWLDSGLARGA